MITKSFNKCKEYINSVHSTGKKSKSAQSVFSRTSSKLSKTSSGNRLDSNTSGGHNLEDDDSDDKDQTLTMTMTMMVGMGTNQRIESLKLRRRSDRINTTRAPATTAISSFSRNMEVPAVASQLMLERTGQGI